METIKIILLILINLSIFLLSAVIIYLLFSFITFNPLWISEAGYNGMRFIYLIGVTILYSVSKLK